MNILVCVKQVPDTTEIRIDPVTNTLIRAGVPSIVNPFDAYALESALRLKDSCGAKVVVLSMGPEQAKNALKECLSVGADKAYLCSDRAFGGSDTLATSYIISRAIKTVEDPVGKLNSDLKGYIVDNEGKTVKPGEEGELWLSAPQISKGYYHMPEKTAKQFVTNPFTQEEGYEKVFKTNDLVRELPDGNMEYVCRKDNMFKIRGFRVECSAVESALMECGHLKEAVAMAFMDKGGCNILCGYIVADYKVDVKALKEKMKEKMPYYMVPTCIIQLDAFPRNVNSKIDRKAIKPPKELDDHKLLEKLY